VGPRAAGVVDEGAAAIWVISAGAVAWVIAAGVVVAPLHGLSL